MLYFTLLVSLVITSPVAAFTSQQLRLQFNRPKVEAFRQAAQLAVINGLVIVDASGHTIPQTLPDPLPDGQAREVILPPNHVREVMATAIKKHPLFNDSALEMWQGLLDNLNDVHATEFEFNGAFATVGRTVSHWLQNGFDGEQGKVTSIRGLLEQQIMDVPNRVINTRRGNFNKWYRILKHGDPEKPKLQAYARKVSFKNSQVFLNGRGQLMIDIGYLQDSHGRHLIGDFIDIGERLFDLHGHDFIMIVESFIDRLLDPTLGFSQRQIKHIRSLEDNLGIFKTIFAPFHPRDPRCFGPHLGQLDLKLK